MKCELSLRRALMFCLGSALGWVGLACPLFAQPLLDIGSVSPVEASVASQENLVAEGSPVRRFKLDNGLTVVHQMIPGCSGVGVALLVPAGSAQDPPDRQGCAHLTEHLAYRAVPGFSASKLALEWERLGAQRGALTTPEYAMFWELVPARSWDSALAIEAGRLRGLVCDKDSLQTEKKQVAVELSSLQNNSWRQLNLQARRALLPAGSESSVCPDGKKEQIEALSEAELKRFYAEHYRPDLAILAVVGGIDVDTLRQRLNATLGTIAPAETAQAESEKPVAAEPVKELAQGSTFPSNSANPGVEQLRVPASVAAGSVAPGSVAAGSVASGSVAPGSAASGSVAPGSVAPGSVAPGSAVSGSAASGSVAPGSVAPRSSVAGSSEPEPEPGLTNSVALDPSPMLPGTVAFFAPLPSGQRPLYAVVESLLWRGPTSRMARRINQRGWSHLVRLQEPDRSGGFAALAVNVGPDGDIDEVARGISEDLHTVAQSVPLSPEFEAARKRTLAEFYQRWQEPAKRAQMMARAQQQQRLTELLDFPRAVRACSPRLVTQCWQNLIHNADWATYVSWEGGDPVRVYGPDASEVYAGSLYESEVLSNGLRMTVSQDDAQNIVYLRGYIDGGALCDPPDKPGLTYFAAGLLAQGLDQRTKCAFAEELEDRGMTLEFKGDSQVIAISGSCLGGDINRFLDILATALQDSHPSEAIVNSWRRSCCNELALREESAENRATALLMQNLFPAGHAFGRFYAGESAKTALYSRQEALDHLYRCVQPSKVGLCFSGPVVPDVIFRKLQSRLGAWQDSGENMAFSVPQAKRSQKGKRFVLNQDGGEIMLVGQLGPGRQDSDYYAFNLLNQILGGNSTLSRLPLRVVHAERLGSSVQTRVLPSQGAAPWAAVMRLYPGKAERALAIVKQEMARLISPGPTKEEIDRAKVTLENQLILQAASPKTRAALLCAIDYHRLDDRLLEDGNSVYREITPARLHLVAKKWFDPDRLTVVISRPAPSAEK